MSLINASVIKPSYMVAAEDLRSNDGQWKAYNSQGNCVILAGPGSGKTKALTIKMARLLAEEVPPPQGIACITYSNQCARELKRRLSMLGVRDDYRISIGTLHSFCLHNLVLPYCHLAKLPKRYPITIASEKDMERIKQQAINETRYPDSWSPSIEKYRRTYLDRSSSEWKNTDGDIAKVVERYEALLDEESIIDFDGMVLIGLHLVEKFSWVRKAIRAKYPILLVDEYQDLGIPLDCIVQSLCFDAGVRLIAVGDPDQSIYGFTGAQPQLLQNLSQRKDVQTIELKLNYRCGNEIIKASEVALGEKRGFHSGMDEPGAVYFHAQPAGIRSQATVICDKIIPESIERYTGRQMGDIAVLYLDKNDGNIIADAVNERRWEYVRVDGNNPYKPSPVTYWLEDCAAWCAKGWKMGNPKLSDIVNIWSNMNNRITTNRERQRSKVELVKYLYANRAPDMLLHDWLSGIINSCLGETLDGESTLHDDKDKVLNLLAVTKIGQALSAYTVGFFGGQAGSSDHLNLTTLHSAKGLEYDVVIIMGLEDGRIPYYNAGAETIKESRRLFYVGLTRARHEVHLVYSGWYKKYGRCYSNGRCRFIDEVQKAIMK